LLKYWLSVKTLLCYILDICDATLKKLAAWVGLVIDLKNMYIKNNQHH
jgi:hypothetical protein